MTGRTEFTPDPDKDWCVYEARVDEIGDTLQVEAAQFYHRDGSLVLFCSDKLPAELMAKALHAAWLVLQEECDKRFA